MAERLSEGLRASAADLWEGQHRHPFVTGIGDASLPVERFQVWLTDRVGQDANRDGPATRLPGERPLRARVLGDGLVGGGVAFVTPCSA